MGRTLGGLERAALELLEPMEPCVSDNILNGAVAVERLERFERASVNSEGVVIWTFR
jgi:hypothetical protein